MFYVLLKRFSSGSRDGTKGVDCFFLYLESGFGHNVSEKVPIYLCMQNSFHSKILISKISILHVRPNTTVKTEHTVKFSVSQYDLLLTP